MYAAGDGAHNQTFLSFPAAMAQSRRDDVDGRLQPGGAIERALALKSLVAQLLARVSLRRCASSGAEMIRSRAKVHDFFMRKSDAGRGRKSRSRSESGDEICVP
jgi:hypothetical protein